MSVPRNWRICGSVSLFWGIGDGNPADGAYGRPMAQVRQGVAIGRYAAPVPNCSNCLMANGPARFGERLRIWQSACVYTTRPNHVSRNPNEHDDA